MMYKHILSQQFQLAYFGRVDFISTENMSVTERNMLWDMLVEQKKEEKKAQEQAIQDAKSKAKPSSWRRRN